MSPLGRPRMGMLDRVKDGDPLINTIRKDLPKGRKQTHTLEELKTQCPVHVK